MSGCLAEVVGVGGDGRLVALPAVDRAAEFDDWAVSAAPALLRLAYVITRNDHDAADAVQDAMLAVFGAWRRLHHQGTHDAYARRVIVNKTISRWRRIGRRERMLDHGNGLDCGPDGSGVDSGGSRGSGVDLAAASTDAVLAHQLLISLPPRQRAAVSLRFFDDLPFGQIADILDCAESTARSYVHRALVSLREQLSDTPAEQAGHV